MRPRAVTLARVAFASGVLISASLAGVTAHRADASRQTEIERRIKELRRAVGEASAQEADLLDKVAAASAIRAELDKIVAGWDAKVDEAQGRLDVAEQQLHDENARLDLLTRQMTDTKQQVVSARHMVSHAAVELYIAGHTNTVFAGIGLSSKSPSDLFVAQEYVRESGLGTFDEITQLQVLTDRIDEITGDTRIARDAVKSTRDRIDTETQFLKALRAEQAKARDAALGQQRQEQHAVDQVRQQKQQFESEIDQLQKESAAITAFLRKLQAGQTAPPPKGNGFLKPPAAGGITSEFGRRFHPILHYYRLHAGADYHAGQGEAIYAARSGTVAFAGPRGGYGNCTIIDHGNGVATLYAHQSKILVREGESVKTGEVIGKVGSTGLSTGPHLHFEVRVQGQPVNPRSYL